MEWKTVKLQDVCIRITDGSHFSPQAQTEGYPMFSVKDMLEYGFDYSNCKRISKADFDGMVQNDCVPQKGDVLVAKDGSFLKSIFLCKETKEEAILSSIAIFRPDDKKILPAFLCYLLKSPSVYNYIASNCVSGSALPRIVLKDFKQVDLSIPDIETQRRIAAILSSLDDKIENNNRINANLEAQAQALFKSRFVDFEPWGGIMPKDWKKYELGEFLPVKTGKKDANIASKIGTYPFFSCAQDILYTDNYSFDGNAILVAGNGDFNVKWYRGKFEAYQRTYVLIPDDARYLGWLFYAVKHNLGKITSGARGSVIKFITKGNLENFAFVAPSDLENYKIIEKFNIINENIEQNQKESQRLAQVRDTLLPKLMRGEIEL